MTRGEGACLVCGKPLVYFEDAKEMECVMCHKKFNSYASCEDGHFVCDDCHEKRGIEVIMEGCLNSNSKNPITLMQELMENPYIYMHGPEHHVMVGAALLTSFYNCGGFEDKGGREAFEKALLEMKARGKEVPGGICGMWGCCGAAVSTGIFISIITKSTPLAGKTWGTSNLMTSRSLQAIGVIGGPRCCKRDSFTAVTEAVAYVEEHFGIRMEMPEKIYCDFSDENAQCIRKKCPYYKDV